MSVLGKIKEIHKKQVLLGILYMVSFLVIGFCLGILPHGQFLTDGLMYAVVGQSNVSNLESVFSFNYLNQYIPYGMRLTEAFGVFFLAHLCALTGISEAVVFQTIVFLFYTLSYISLLWVMIKLSDNRFIAWVITVVFFMNPCMVAQKGVPTIYLGILFLPVLLLELYKFNQFIVLKLDDDYKTVVNNKKDWIYIIINFLMFLIEASTSWYIAIIIACGVCLYFLMYYLSYVKEKSIFKLVQLYIVYTIIPWIVALALILLITPREVAETTTAFDFMNGSSIDILTMLLPCSGQLLGRFIGVDKVIPDNEYIPGNGVNFYLGYTILILIIWSVFWKKGRNRNEMALAISGVILFIISLGPGLRIACTLNESMLSEIGQYRLPLENDILIFPWANLFMKFPLNIMRAVYRWYIGAIFLFIILAAVTLGKIRKYHKFGIILTNILCVCLLIEFLPSGFSNSGVYNYKEYEQVYEDCVEELEGIFEGENNKLVFSSYDFNSNTYLVPLIMSQLDDCETYSGAGDKARGFATRFQPQCVLECETSADPESIAVNITKIAELKLADYVVFPYFDLSNAVYSWPADESIVEKTKDITKQVEEQLDGRYNIIYLPHYMIVELSSDDNYMLVVDAEKESEHAVFLPSDEGFGSKYAIEIKKVSYTQQINPEDDMLYVSSILKGKDEDGININVEYYNENDVLLNSDVITVHETEKYALTEFTLDIPNGTNYIKYDFYNDTEGTSYLKKLYSTTYKAENIMKTSEMIEMENLVGLEVESMKNVSAENEKLDFTEDSALLLKDNKMNTGQNMNINLDLYLGEENSQDIEILNKWLEWQQDMTFALAYHSDDDSYYFNISNDGKEAYGCSWSLADMPKDTWNNLNITFDKGHIMVKINEKVVVEEECGFENLHISQQPIRVGNGMVGKVKNFKYNAN